MSQISDPSTSGSPDILLTKFHRFTARAFRKLLSIYVFSYLPFGFEGRIWDLIGSVPGARFTKLFMTELIHKT